ncbi:MAG TPA: flavin reductase family protein [Thermoanaerobaculia bacterium]|nr:flavin reductase family protein [Thermoanaerobaculia bacterium]
MISSEDFRKALRHFPAGVTIVTVKAGERKHGLTVSAFASVSAEPPLIMIIIENRHHAHSLLEEPEAVFAVNILGEGQSELSNRFAWVKDEDRFAMGNWSTSATGAPILEDALAWLDCRIHARYPAGSHTIYVGEVAASQVPEEEAPPLVYWNRGYRKLHLHEEEPTA